MNPETFKDLNLDSNILRALTDAGYEKPTPIQLAAIPPALQGRDILALAQTGTGKTAGFSLPILQRFCEMDVEPNRGARKPKALVLSPTRELALQIERSLIDYGKFLKVRTLVILGGVSMGNQVRDLKRGADIIVATPGRLLDHMRSRSVDLSEVEMLVLDEADRMLDMGFINDVKTLVSRIRKDRQTFLFSATMSPEIRDLSRELLKDPSVHEITPQASISEKISQRVLFVEKANKQDLLRTVLEAATVKRALVFTRTKHQANRLAEKLSRSGISTEAIHSNKSQSARQRALQAFERGRVKVLVATDIVARGIDVDNITHVVNYELPEDAESYVHRIGRTARAGAIGEAISFCDGEELPLLNQIEKLTKQTFEIDVDHPYHSDSVFRLQATLRERNNFGRFSRSRGGQRGGGRPQGNSRGPSRNGNGSGNNRRPQSQDRRGGFSGQRSESGNRSARAS